MTTLKNFVNQAKVADAVDFFNDFLKVSCKKGWFGFDLKTYPNGCAKPKFSMVVRYTSFWKKSTILQLTSRF